MLSSSILTFLEILPLMFPRIDHLYDIYSQNYLFISNNFPTTWNEDGLPPILSTLLTFCSDAVSFADVSSISLNIFIKILLLTFPSYVSNSSLITFNDLNHLNPLSAWLTFSKGIRCSLWNVIRNHLYFSLTNWNPYSIALVLLNISNLSTGSWTLYMCQFLHYSI